MIVTRTPFRITLGGGGTDLPSYYEKHGGFIFGMGLDKYMYIMIGRPIIDEKIRLHYSQSETVDHLSELRHELAREALRLRGIERGVEISSMADLPAGTGLGSSSSYLVGLLAGLQRYCGPDRSAAELAEEACHIELDLLGKGIGKQDQYMAAFGGLTVLEIERGGQVGVRKVSLPESVISDFVENTHLYYTGVQRDAEAVLSQQNQALGGGARDREPGADLPGVVREDGGQSVAEPAAEPASIVEDSLHRIKDLGHRILDVIEAGDFDAWGRLMHEHWCNKKRMSDRISLGEVDRLYDHVREEYGVLGGKIAGAGGGGFLMLYCPDDHERLEAFMASQGMPRLHYDVEYEGAKVVANLSNSTAPLVAIPAAHA